MIVQNFRMIMRNQLDNSPLAYNIIPHSSPFRIVMRNGNILFLSFLLSFLPFLLLNPPQLPPNHLQILVQVH